MEPVWQIVGYVIPALVVFVVTYFTLQAFLNKEYKLRLIEYRQTAIREALPVRLQAYERLTLFLERIALNNLLPRVRKGDMTTAEFRTALINNIKMEYEHNLSQQVYVSNQSWAMIKIAKEEVIGIINRNSMELPPDVPGIELHKKILAEMAETSEDEITSRAAGQLKKEVLDLYER